jgi:hypothetical protein
MKKIWENTVIAGLLILNFPKIIEAMREKIL